MHRECLLHKPETEDLGKPTDSSLSLVRSTIELFPDTNNKSLVGGDTNVLHDLKRLVLDMSSDPKIYDKTSLIEAIRIALGTHSLIPAIEKNINSVLSPVELRISIRSLYKQIDNVHKERGIRNLLSSASYKLNAGLNKNDGDIQTFVARLAEKISSLAGSQGQANEGIVDEIDMHNTDQLNTVMDSVKSDREGTTKLLTGWGKVNKMVNGGFRRGEQWVISALQHNYKSGFLHSLFVQLATINTPVLTDPKKKPLIILFSFEDDVNIITEFLYRYMYYSEHQAVPDLSKVTGKEIGEYLTKGLSKTGYHVKILRINPSEWSYRDLFDKISSYESQGYEIHAVLIDYLSKLPTIGCDRSGASGTDVRDLFNRVRNFCASKNILNITPHQVSTEALQLVRNGVRNMEFITELSNKNYYSESKQIPQVVDGEIYITKGRINSKWALFIGKGKHRTPIITPDVDKQAILYFPKNAPIPPDGLSDAVDDEGVDTATENTEVVIDDNFDF